MRLVLPLFMAASLALLAATGIRDTFGAMAGVISLIPLGAAAGVVCGVILPMESRKGTRETQPH